MSPFAQLADDLHNVHPATGAQDAVNAGNLLRDLGAVALGQAAGRDQELVGAFGFGQRTQHVERFLARRADKSARVDDQHAGLLGRFYEPIAILFQQLGHRVGVDRVLCAAERGQVESFSIQGIYGLAVGVREGSGVEVGVGVGVTRRVAVGVGSGVGVGFKTFFGV